LKHSTIACCLAILLTTTPLFAGGLSDPVVTPEIIIADAEQSSADLDGVMAMLAIMLALAVSGGAF